MSRAILAFTIIAMFGGRAIADPDAKTLFEEARVLAKAGNWPEACPIFERSFRLAPAPGTMLNLGLCWKEIGRLADSLRMLERFVREAKDDFRIDSVKETIEALSPKVPKLTIHLGTLPQGTVVELDGNPIKVDDLTGVDPGPHDITAVGARPVHYVAHEGATGEVTLEEKLRYKRAPLVLGLGAGAAGALLIGTFTGIATLRAKSAALDHCNDNVVCDQQGLDKLGHARTLSHVTTVMFLVGLGVGGAAGYLEFKARHEVVPPITIDVGGGGASVQLGGSW